MTVLRDTHGDAAPNGRVAYVTGEAGIGKSRLAEDLGAEVSAARGAVIVARSFASETGIAYGVIVGLLRVGLSHPDAIERLRRLPPDTLDELGRLVPLPAELSDPRGAGDVRGVAEDGPAARARLLEAVAGALAALVAGPAPGLITVEDIQWADDASREALAWLARRLESRSLLLLLTWRPEDLDDLASAFAATVDALPSAVSVPLRRLDGDDVERLVAAASTMGGPSMAADALLEESEGLPLFVVEALAAGTSTVEGPTRSVRTLLRERLATVSETAGQVLSAAAVIGRSFDLPLVRGASGRSEDETVTALEELVRRGIVREVPAAPEVAFDFAHAKLRDAAYDATSLARRRLLHRRTAELLRAEGGGRDDPGRLVQIAIHERAAGREAEAADAFRQAGVQARSLFANREAAAHLETAIGLGHPEVAGIQLLLGEVRMALGDYAGAIAALEAAAAATSDDELSRVELRLGRVHARRGDLATAASHLDAAVATLEPGATATGAHLLARALVERAVVAHRAGELDLAHLAASRALSIAEAVGDGPGAGAAHRILGLVARETGDLDAARVSLGHSLALAGADPDAGAAIAARNALALVEAAAGNRAAAIALLEAALEECRRTGERHLEAAVENSLADQLHAVGRTDEAMAHLKQAVAIFAEVGGNPGELEPEIWKLVAW
jgi:predicted ATPase